MGHVSHHPSLIHPLYSLQQYVRHLGSSDDFGPSRFNHDDAQRIMLLDLRTLNQDRHGGNVLVTSNDQRMGVFGELSPLSPSERSDTDPGYSASSSINGSDLFGAKTYRLPSAPPGPLRRCHSVGPALETVTVRSSSTRKPRSSLSVTVGGNTDCVGGGGGSDGLRLIPIDHGFALPHPLVVDETEFCWLHWVSPILIHATLLHEIDSHLIISPSQYHPHTYSRKPSNLSVKIFKNTLHPSM